jgi:hypothetical protein
MAVKGILFNTEMVRAILDGRKTITRRVIKFPKNRFNNEFPKSNDIAPCEIKNNKVSFIIESIFIYKVVPPYKPGDILYVRETWFLEEFYDNGAMIKYRAGGELPIDYDCEGETYHKLCKFAEVEDYKWIPSIHMPKEAARIWLKVTDVRVERLQDITEKQARMEGVLSPYHYADNDEYWEATKRNRLPYDIAAFSALWDSTIKKPDLDIYGWEANPWVWAVGFERCDKPKG